MGVINTVIVVESSYPKRQFVATTIATGANLLQSTAKTASYGGVFPSHEKEFYFNNLKL